MTNISTTKAPPPPPSDFPLRACPTCHTESTGHFQFASKPKAEDLPFAEVTSIWNSATDRKPFFSYTRCAKCGLLYAPRIFSTEQRSQLPPPPPDPDQGMVPDDALRKTHLAYFSHLAKHSTLENGYLEIGAAGYLTANCARRGQFNKYWLVESNRNKWPDFEKIVERKPHEILETFDDLKQIQPETIGLVVLVHTLDKLPDPVSLLKELKLKLTINGKLFIVMHDETSLLRQLLSRSWPVFSLHQPQAYNPSTIKAMLKESGFKAVTIQKAVNYFPLQFLLKHLFRALKIKKADKIPAFGNLVVGLKLGDLCVVAKSSTKIY